MNIAAGHRQIGQICLAKNARRLALRFTVKATGETG